MEGAAGSPEGARQARLGVGQVILATGGAAATAPRQEHVAGLHRLSDPQLSELGTEALLDELLLRVREILGVDTVAVLLLDDSGEELVARAAKGLEEEVEHRVRIPVGRGFAGRIASERAPIFIAEVERADVVNPILRIKGVRSLLGVPLIAEGKLVGVLHVGSLQPRTFTVDDALMLELAALRAAPAIERARIAEALEREREAAVVLQRSLLPTQLPEFVEVDLAARYLAARDGVGGDWYDAIALPQGKIGIVIGDVVGHGVRAAATMGQVRTALRAYALEDHDPATVLGLVDRLLQSGRQEAMATACYGVFHPEDGSLDLATAGHPPPLLIGAEPRYLEVEARPPLGARAFTTYSTRRFTVAPDECVLFYTDGLVEVRGQSIEHGLRRLRDEAVAAGTSAEHVCRWVTQQLVPLGGAGDDVAVLALRNVPIADGLSLRLPAEPDVLSTVRNALRRWLRHHGASAEAIQALVLATGEACANAVEHAYGLRADIVEVSGRRDGDSVEIRIRDWGRWRERRERGRGRGLAIIESTADSVEHHRTPEGTEVVLRRRLGGEDD